MPGNPKVLAARAVLAVHVASLDAPLVGIAWQHALARCFGVRLEPVAYGILFLSIWLAYSGDRWLDVVIGRGSRDVTERHRFAHRFAIPMAVLWLALFIFDIVVAIRFLERDLLNSGWFLFAAVLAYLGLAQWHRVALARIPKEVVAGGLFAIGTAWFASARLLSTAEVLFVDAAVAAIAVMAYAAMCILNCLAISSWEYALDRHRGEPAWTSRERLGSLVRVGARALQALALLAALVTLVLAPGFDRFGAASCFLAIALAARALGWLHLRAERFDIALLRAVVDLLLLTPAPLLVARMMRDADGRARACPDYDRVAPYFLPLERLAFGRAMERARFAFLDAIEPPERVLLLGEGDGRYLARLCSRFPRARIDCIDASVGMLELARSRIRSDQATAVRFVQGDIRHVEWPSDRYDLIVSNFFLDCFDEEEIGVLVERVTAVAAGRATWCIADFARPSGMLALRSRLWLGMLYAFFGRVARQRVRRLVDPVPALERTGWCRVRRESVRWGLLYAERWDLEAGEAAPRVDESQSSQG